MLVPMSLMSHQFSVPSESRPGNQRGWGRSRQSHPMRTAQLLCTLLHVSPNWEVLEVKYTLGFEDLV